MAYEKVRQHDAAVMRELTLDEIGEVSGGCQCGCKGTEVHATVKQANGGSAVEYYCIM